MTILSVGELMTAHIEIISTVSSAQEASKKMRDKNVSLLLVMDGDKSAGIVTEPFITVDSTLPVEEAANVMIQNKVRHLLVTNNNDITKIVGVITPTDFIGYLKENLNLDNKLNAKLLEFLREPREENIVQELEQEGKLQRDSQRGGQEYEDEQPRQG